ncbi:GNAT family N-acetyltransferase [Nibribacter ruber]|uniref:GNAT family N-acetyltransferase n=1 Tax=Nibribacter ruber TaxID=2698458 RepID=A0A6P1NSY8_9BACT|nr:GNAT family N-acetyltransferase [Nibribacter ruber]QHL86817.1 GNAT family N-acetyltransferase [Nibribacter ruber]
METTLICKPFQDFTPFELYENLRLRSDVFVVEQTCVFLDLDNKDQACHHVLVYQNGVLEASSRLVPPGVSYPEASIGRVVTSQAARGTGLGKKLMEASIAYCQELFGEGPIKIGAQVYARKFYENLGFVQAGDVYDEDGIDHIHMIRP